MTIARLINEYGENYLPYSRGIVNHLPMTQMILYKNSGNLDRVEKFTRDHVKRFKLDLVKGSYPECVSIENCLGKENKYESYLNMVEEEVDGRNLEKYIGDILNTYDLGISSGIFHPLLRIKHAMDGYKIDERLIDEVKRAATFYITSYKKADIFKPNINNKDIIQSIEELRYNKRIKKLIINQETTGEKIQALYRDPEYLQTELLVDGDRDIKIKTLLDILLPLFINSGNLIVLHCITALEALISLEKYYNDFDRTLDIFTTSVITHIMTLNKIDFTLKQNDSVEFSWNYLLDLGTESRDVHNIEFTSSCHEIFKKYPDINLKRATLKRVDIYSP